MESKILEVLGKIQAELKAPKNQRNSFGNYDYRSAEDILEALKPLERVYGAVTTLTDEIVYVGTRHYVKATATIHTADGSYSVSASAREEETKKGMDAAQITGAASSYARKYALNGLYAIDDTKDADTKGNRPDNTPAQKVSIPAEPPKAKTEAAKKEDIKIEDISTIVGARAVKVGGVVKCLRVMVEKIEPRKVKTTGADVTDYYVIDHTTAEDDNMVVSICGVPDATIAVGQEVDFFDVKIAEYKGVKRGVAKTIRGVK